MKFGFRKPSFKKRLSARTSWRRVVRHRMGLKMPRGGGFISDPKKFGYNKVYSRTSSPIANSAILIAVLVLLFYFFR